MSMNASIFPVSIRVIQDDDDTEWTHTLRLEDEDGSTCHVFLTQETLVTLWNAVESPEIKENRHGSIEAA